MRQRSESSVFDSVSRWACVALLTLVTGTLIAWVAAEALIVRSDFSQVDAPAVLAGSSTYLERTHRAAQLFNEGRAAEIPLPNDHLQSGVAAEEERHPLFVEREAAGVRGLCGASG